MARLMKADRVTESRKGGEEKKERLGEKSLEGDLQVPRQEEGRCRKGECFLPSRAPNTGPVHGHPHPVPGRERIAPGRLRKAGERVSEDER